MTAKRAKFECEDYDTEFAVRWMQKDLHLAAISGYSDLDISAIDAFLNRPGKHQPD